MSSFAFTVLPSGVGELHDILSCLMKFDENVALEANSSSVSLLIFLCLLSAHLRSFAFLV